LPEMTFSHFLVSRRPKGVSKGRGNDERGKGGKGKVDARLSAACKFAKHLV